MQRAVENISEKTGMPPGSFVPVGVKDGIPSKFFIYNISDKKTTVQETASLSADLLKHDNNTVLWVMYRDFPTMIPFIPCLKPCAFRLCCKKTLSIPGTGQKLKRLKTAC